MKKKERGKNIMREGKKKEGKKETGDQYDREEGKNFIYICLCVLCAL